MKKIIGLLLCFFTVFLIFIFTKDEKINYLAIGDTLTRGVNSYNYYGNGYNDYVKNYLKRNNLLRSFNSDYYNNSIIGFENDIINNKTIVLNDKEYYIKKMLRESDLLVISIGMDELSYYFNEENDINKIHQEFDKMLLNLEDFINVVRDYAKNDILFVGYYNPLNNYNSDIDELFYYIEDSLGNMLKKYDVNYIKLYEMVKNSNYLDNRKNYHLNSKGYLMIANEIINYIENVK